MKISTCNSGLRASWIFNSTAEEPSQRSVVFCPINGRPSWSQRATALPLRTFRIVPTANQPTTTTTATKKRVRPASGEMTHRTIIQEWLSHFRRYCQRAAIGAQQNCNQKPLHRRGPFGGCLRASSEVRRGRRERQKYQLVCHQNRCRPQRFRRIRSAEDAKQRTEKQGG